MLGVGSETRAIRFTRREYDSVVVAAIHGGGQGDRRTTARSSIPGGFLFLARLA